MTIPILWILVIVLPKKIAAKITKAYAYCLLLAICRFKVVGQENLEGKPPVIFVANHASYLDSLVLTAILPINVAFVGKQELLKVPLLSTFLKKFAHVTVDRLDFAKSSDEISKIKAILQQGRSILIFPEGTFSYVTGVRPFKLGAFKLSAEVNAAICPIAIKGTRKILRSGSTLPRLGKVRVTILEVVQPHGIELPEINHLRVMTRKVIAQHCGELALDLMVAGYQDSESSSGG